MVSLLQLNREIERMVTHDVTVAKIEIALVLLDKLGEEMRSYKSAHSEKTRLVEPVDCYGIALISPKDRDHVAFDASEEPDVSRSL